jgi:predicted amidohydrolase YtcJ
MFGEDGRLTLKDLQQGMPYLGIHTGFGNEWLKIAGVKLIADGITESPVRTAWMYEEYTDAPGVTGSLVVPGETDEERYNEFINMIVYAHKHGFQVGIHSIGDRAIDACVDGIIKAMKEEPRECHHYVIHGDFVTAQCAKRMAEYNIGVNPQPGFIWALPDLAVTVGEERAAYAEPLRTLIDTGVHMMASSDAPVIYPSWTQGVEAAVLRESKATGKVRSPEQCITREEVIRAYTIGGAWQDHMENIKGSIEVGKLADFCVLDEDILTINAHKIKDIRTLMTIVGGKIVYDAR